MRTWKTWVEQVASMEPRPLGRGMPSGVPVVRPLTPRFNGATTSRSWNGLCGPGGSGVDDHASMEPRPLGRGMREDRAKWPTARRSFNGATTSRSWNGRRGPRPVEGPAVSFNGATTSRSWNGRRGPRPVEGPAVSFNGATTSRSWNGPFAHGLPPRSTGFNGATTSRSWNALAEMKHWLKEYMLQWSHDLSVVECRCLHRSMGVVVVGFNGATTSRSWNVDHRHLGVRRPERASMEPRPLGRGMPGRTGRCSGCAPGASMEPRPLGRGMRPPPEQARDVHRASMEPRPLGRGMDVG